MMLKRKWVWITLLLFAIPPLLLMFHFDDEQYGSPSKKLTANAKKDLHDMFRKPMLVDDTGSSQSKKKSIEVVVLKEDPPIEQPAAIEADNQKQQQKPQQQQQQQQQQASALNGPRSFDPCELIVNPSFESVQADPGPLSPVVPGWPEPKIGDIPRFGIEYKRVHTGNKAIRLDTTSGKKNQMVVTSVEVQQKQSGPLRLGVWVSGERIGAGDQGIWLDVQLQDRRFVKDLRVSFPQGTYDYVEVVAYLDMPEAIESIFIVLSMYEAIGVAYVDDVSLRAVDKVPSDAAGVVVWKEQLSPCFEDSQMVLPPQGQDPPQPAHAECRQFFKFYLKGRREAEGGDDVTLAMQTSLDRIGNVVDHFRQWEGLITVVILIREWRSEVSAVDSIIQGNPDWKERVDIHLVHWQPADFPVNSLRNLLFDSVRTENIFMVDVDFIASNNAYQHLRRSLNQRNSRKELFVVPAFDPVGDMVFDKDKLQGRANVVQQSKSRCAHGATDTNRWFGSGSNYQVTWEECYEPYVVGSVHMPKYDERFASYGGDKSSHIYELSQAGYSFIVQPNVFILHKPHSAGSWASKYDWRRAWFNVMGHYCLMEPRYYMASMPVHSECMDKGIITQNSD